MVLSHLQLNNVEKGSGIKFCPKSPLVGVDPVTLLHFLHVLRSADLSLGPAMNKKLNSVLDFQLPILMQTNIFLPTITMSTRVSRGSMYMFVVAWCLAESLKTKQNVLDETRLTSGWCIHGYHPNRQLLTTLEGGSLNYVLHRGRITHHHVLVADGSSYPGVWSSARDHSIERWCSYAGGSFGACLD